MNVNVHLSQYPTQFFFCKPINQRFMDTPLKADSSIELQFMLCYLYTS